MRFDPVWYALAKKGAGSGGGGDTPSGGEEWFNDGNTHIWISLTEGRTSPMLGVGVNGTVMVDWGDGSAPDTLTGTSASTVVYTPVHEYGKASDYVITLSGGEINIIGGSSGSYLLVASSVSSDKISYSYRNAIKKVEYGNNAKNVDGFAFYYCYSLANVATPKSAPLINNYAFSECHSLASVEIPEGVTQIAREAFNNCYALTSVVIPESVTNISANVFYNCNSLTSVTIPKGVTYLAESAFYGCNSLTSVAIPKGVKTVNRNTFCNCYSAKYFDFTNHTAVPTLSATSAFAGIPSDCQIRVPAALVDEWKAATNWATYADYIVGV